MVKVFLSINNNEEVMLLPVTPEIIEVEREWENQEVKGMYQPMNVIGNKKLDGITLQSFFPVRDYPFSLNREMYGLEYVETLLRWMERRFPLRLVIIDEEMPTLNVNIPVTVDKFTTRTGKDGDIYYTLGLKEFRFVEVK